MKKTLCLFALCLSVLLLTTACQKRQDDIVGEGSPTIPGAGRDASSMHSSEYDPFPSSVPEATPTTPDTPIYRGTVIEREEDAGFLKLKLESPAGVDYGYRSILMQTGEETKAGFDLNEIKVGDHLEVEFAERNDGLPPVILSASKLAPAQDTVFNGEVLRYEAAADGHVLELKAFDSDDATVFHIGKDTQLFLDEDLAPGQRVNIYHRGTLTRSNPPQGQALEVRPYFEAAANE